MGGIQLYAAVALSGFRRFATYRVATAAGVFTNVDHGRLMYDGGLSGLHAVRESAIEDVIARMYSSGLSGLSGPSGPSESVPVVGSSAR